jgi:capsular exopolysaccharide synthesis family protein
MDGDTVMPDQFGGSNDDKDSARVKDMSARFSTGRNLTRNQQPLGSEPGGEKKVTAGVPLARLIKRKLTRSSDVVLLEKPRSVAAERFRRLRTLLANMPDGGPQVIVVTSAGPDEGKSFVALNLALAFASEQQGEVLLIDADLRRPHLDRILDPPPTLGLSELLKGATEPVHAILDLENSPLRVLPAGTPPREPVELLASDSASDLASELRKDFRRIVIDTPPIVPFTDADVLGALADGILLVARAGRTRRSSYLQAVSSVSSTKVLGTVLNDQTYTLADRSSYSEYIKGYYEYHDKDKDE